MRPNAFKIGIFTFHRSINCGAFMQTYSLSRRIQERFPNAKVEVVDYTSAIMENIYKIRLNKSAVRHPIVTYLKSRQKAKFRQSLQALPLSSKSMCCDGKTDEVLATYQDDYDVFVVGSDAVWNWCKRGFPNPYLMNFQKDVIKMSYAASAFGMGREWVGETEREYFKSSLEKFSFIGVRDEYTTSLVKDICPDCEPVFTCDPTVFLNLEDVYAEIGLTKKEFKDYIYNKYKIPKEKKLIGVMGAPLPVVEKLKKEYGKGYVLVSLYAYTKGADIQAIDLSPFEWAVMFGLFEFTVTNYFHGTLLSLRNYTPVLNVDFSDFSKKEEGKIHDVMRRIDLLDCHFTSPNDSDKMIEQIKNVVSNRDEYVNKIKKNIKTIEESSERFFEKLENCIK